FQAEDGIRDFHVTGVQTCALPISTVGAPTDRTRSPLHATPPTCTITGDRAAAHAPARGGAGPRGGASRAPAGPRGGASRAPAGPRGAAPARARSRSGPPGAAARPGTARDAA